MSQNVIVYADGSCLGNHLRDNFGGWGAILIWNGRRKEISGAESNTTNNRMELTSCIRALEELKRNDLVVDLHMDSSYVVNAVNLGWLQRWQGNGWKKSDGKKVENRDLWETLARLLEHQSRVRMIKVEAHKSDELNNLVDRLARNAATEMKKKLQEDKDEL